MSVEAKEQGPHRFNMVIPAQEWQQLTEIVDGDSSLTHTTLIHHFIKLGLKIRKITDQGGKIIFVDANGREVELLIIS